MSNQIKVLKVSEIIWLVIAAVSLIMGIREALSGAVMENYNYFLFVITAVAVIMHFLRKKRRRSLEKLQEEENRQKP